MDSIASNLRAERARAQLSMAELSRLSGISVATICAIESGNSVNWPTVKTLSRLAEAMQIPLCRLFQESPVAA